MNPSGVKKRLWEDRIFDNENELLSRKANTKIGRICKRNKGSKLELEYQTASNQSSTTQICYSPQCSMECTYTYTDGDKKRTLRDLWRLAINGRRFMFFKSLVNGIETIPALCWQREEFVSETPLFIYFTPTNLYDSKHVVDRASSALISLLLTILSGHPGSAPSFLRRFNGTSFNWCTLLIQYIKYAYLIFWRQKFLGLALLVKSYY